MAFSSLFSEEMILHGLHCETAIEAISAITNLMLSLGYVEPAYLNSVIKRELRFPTGVPTAPVPVALAHGDPAYVKRNGIAVGILSAPILFREMGAPEHSLDVEVVFVLAVRQKEKQVHILKDLMNLISNKQALQDLANAKDAKAASIILRCNEET